MSSERHIRWFGEIGLDDIAEVGGKTASLGELHSVLGAQGVRVANGFAITAAAYRDALDAAAICCFSLGLPVASYMLRGRIERLEAVREERRRTAWQRAFAATRCCGFRRLAYPKA